MPSSKQSVATETQFVTAVGTQSKWYAAYTRANHEKRVAEELTLRSIEAFLPLYEEVHQWKDRRRHIKVPLFSNYVFVRTSFESRSIMHQVPGFVRLVGFGGAPTPICNQQVESLRMSLSAGACAEPIHQPLKGRRVRIKSGPFTGFEGLVVRQRKSYRLVVSIDLIQRTVLVDIDPNDMVIERSRSGNFASPYDVKEQVIDT